MRAKTTRKLFLVAFRSIGCIDLEIGEICDSTHKGYESLDIKHRRRTLSDLHLNRDTINLTPMWQRGLAWTNAKQVLLIDSLLRGMDIPKIYFRQGNQANSRFDVVDGQQRLRAIWDFIDGKYELKHPQALQPIEGAEIAGKAYNGLPKKLRDRLKNFKVSVAVISNAQTNDITLLFARLQLAAPLNSAELRNAIMGRVRNEVDTTALHHAFFESSRIASNRMKHQDYAAHAYSLAINGTGADLKAPDLRDLYVKSAEISQQDLMQYSIEVNNALDTLKAVNDQTSNRITQKWMFCDLFLFVLSQLRANKTIDVDLLAETYQAFDIRRLKYLKTADELLEAGSSDDDQDLFAYIQAFRIEGGQQGNVEIRAGVFSRLFKDCVA